MAISNVKLIRRALTLVNVLGVEESAEPEQSEHALDSMNQILARWEARGVNLQYYAQTMEDLPSNCPIPDYAELAVMYYLAVTEAPHYGRPVPADVQALADLYYGELTADAVREKNKPIKPNLPAGEGQLVRGNILTG